MRSNNKNRITKISGTKPPTLFDAVLVHGFWLSEGNRYGLSLRSRLADRAAALIYDQGRGVNNIVLTVGHVWGPEYPSVSQLMARELGEKYHIPKGAIIVRDVANSTLGEVETFLELAKERGWSKLLDITAEKHLWTVPGIFKKYGENVVFKSAEEILKEKDQNPHVKHLLRRLGRSKYEFSLMAYEGTKWVVMHFLDYRKLEERNKEARTKKGKSFILPLDVYKL